jgi:membrane protein DedA with SNARE-associated domain
MIKGNCIQKEMPLVSSLLLAGMMANDMHMNYWLALAVGAVGFQWVNYIAQRFVCKEVDIFEDYRALRMDGSVE